jgi:hypothetical protein
LDTWLKKEFPAIPGNPTLLVQTVGSHFNIVMMMVVVVVMMINVEGHSR